MSNIKKNSFLLLLIAEIIVLAFCLPGCFKQAERIVEYQKGSVYSYPVGTDGTVWQGTEITLTPGIYEVRIQTALGQDEVFVCDVKNLSDHFGSLLANSVTLTTHNEPVQYSIWVLDYIPVQFICSSNSSNSDVLLSLSLWKTNRFNRMVMTALLFAFLLFDALLYLRRGILNGAIEKKRQIVVWGLVAGIFLSFFPYLTDYASVGADTMFHVTRIAALADSWSTGAGFPVRIQSFWNYGHGYAVSLFYGDLFLTFPAFLLLMGFPLLTAYKIFVLLILAITAILAWNCFYRCIGDEYAALVGSLIYLLNPYHLFNVYNRGAIGECIAMMFLPLIFCGAYLLYSDETTAPHWRHHKWYLIIGFSAIVNSHVITTEMTVLCLAVYALLFWKKTFRRATFLQLTEAALITLLVNAWFWVPLIYAVFMDHYHLQTIISQDLINGNTLATLTQLVLNKGGAQIGAYNNEPIQLGIGLLALLLVWIVWSRGRSRTDGEKIMNELSRRIRIFGISTIIFLILSTKYVPWRWLVKIPLLGRILSSFQFPWRWLVMATLFGAVFAAFFFFAVIKEGRRLLKNTVFVILAITLLSVIFHVNSIAYGSKPLYLYDIRNLGSISFINGEYLLEEVEEFGLNLKYHDPVAEDGVTWSDYHKNGIRIFMELSNDTDRTLSISVPLLGYKGYGVHVLERELNGSPEPFVARDRGEHGDLKIDVPADFHGKIEIYYRGFPLFRVAEMVSCISILACAGSLFFGREKKSGKKHLAE